MGDPTWGGGAPLQGGLGLHAPGGGPGGPPARLLHASPGPGASPPAQPAQDPGPQHPLGQARVSDPVRSAGCSWGAGPWALYPWPPVLGSARSVGGAWPAARATWGHLLPRGLGAPAGGRVSVGVCRARGAASSLRVASSPSRPGQGEGPLTSVAAGGEVAQCEQQHGHQRQHLGAPHAEVVVDLPLAQVVGQSRHLGSSMTTARGGTGKGRRTGAALELPPPQQPGEERPPLPAAATRAARRGA